MALSAFDSRARAPTPADLKASLGRSALLWDALVARVREAHAPVESIWNFAGAKFGWSMRLVRKGRVMLYLIPQDGHFLAGLVLGGKAEAAARAAGLPEAVLALLDAAPRYAEGRGVRLPVRLRADLGPVERLLAAKMTA